jgi:L-rhamnose-H+ transport protein
MGNDGKSSAIAEFSLWKGLAIATFSGVMSSCFSYGFQFGDPITKISANHGTGPYWVGLPVIVVILLGGLTTNFIWLSLRARFEKRGIKGKDGKTAGKSGTSGERRRGGLV